MNGKGVVIGIMLVLLLLLVVYAIALFLLYRDQKLFFAPYKAPTPPGPAFYPLGNVTPLTQEQINQRNALIQAALAS
jgi:flagellar basal body-associated protein FliL